MVWRVHGTNGQTKQQGIDQMGRRTLKEVCYNKRVVGPRTQNPALKMQANSTEAW